MFEVYPSYHTLCSLVPLIASSSSGGGISAFAKPAKPSAAGADSSNCTAKWDHKHFRAVTASQTWLLQRFSTTAGLSAGQYLADVLAYGEGL